MDEKTLKRVATWFNTYMNTFDFEATIENGKIKVFDTEHPDKEDNIKYFDSLYDLLDSYSDLLFENVNLGGTVLESIEDEFIDNIAQMTVDDLKTDQPLIYASNLSKITELRTIVDYKEYWEVA